MYLHEDSRHYRLFWWLSCYSHNPHGIQATIYTQSVVKGERTSSISSIRTSSPIFIHPLFYSSEVLPF